PKYYLFQVVQDFKKPGTKKCRWNRGCTRSSRSSRFREREKKRGSKKSDFGGANPAHPEHPAQMRWNGHQMRTGFCIDPEHPAQIRTQGCMVCGDFTSRLVVVVVVGVGWWINLPFGDLWVEPCLGAVAADE